MCMYLDALNTEAQVGARAGGLSPDHVPWFSDAFLHSLFLAGLIGVHFYHLLVHVLRWKRNIVHNSVSVEWIA